MRAFKQRQKSRLELLEEQHGNIYLKQAELACKIMRLEHKVEKKEIRDCYIKKYEGLEEEIKVCKRLMDAEQDGF